MPVATVLLDTEILGILLAVYVTLVGVLAVQAVTLLAVALPQLLAKVDKSNL